MTNGYTVLDHETGRYVGVDELRRICEARRRERPTVAEVLDVVQSLIGALEEEGQQNAAV